MTADQPGTPATSGELVERVAAAMCAVDAHGVPWERMASAPGHHIRAERYRRFARAAAPLIEAEAAAKVAAIAKQEMQALSEDLLALGAGSMEKACAETAEAVRLASDAKWRENLAAQRQAIAANIRGVYWPDLARKIAGQIERGEL